MTATEYQGAASAAELAHESAALHSAPGRCIAQISEYLHGASPLEESQILRNVERLFELRGLLGLRTSDVQKIHLAVLNIIPRAGLEFMSRGPALVLLDDALAALNAKHAVVHDTHRPLTDRERQMRDFLDGGGYLSKNRLAILMRCSKPTVQKAADGLVQLGLVSFLDGEGWALKTQSS